MTEKKVIAVVVTYNRREKLLCCIEKLLAGTYPQLQILIVDNGSTDGTREAIEARPSDPRVAYANTGKNLGGAGGFSYGISYAFSHFSFDYIWLMDDDCYVRPDSLAELLKADAVLQGNYGFLSSLVLWKDGTICTMNKQKIRQPWHVRGEYLQDGILLTNYATFVSFFLRRQTVEACGLPIAEFVIWGDDVEYSGRIAKQFDCYIAGKSVVLHDTASNIGSNIALDTPDKFWRYRCAYRNEVYIARQNGVKGCLYQLARIALHLLRILTKSKDHRLQRLWVVLCASVQGVFFRPPVRHVEV